MTDAIDKPVEQEPEGLHGRGLLWLGLGTIAVLVGSLLFVWWILPAGLLRMPVLADEPDDPVSGVRQGQFDAAEGLQQRERQRRTLGAYGWKDRDGDIAIIPIERAMDLYVDRQDREAEP
ncbi:MAG: hypothetical protein ACOC97_00675 [Myxococcota bacterium]